MKAQLSYNWITDKDFNAQNPLSCTIKGCFVESKGTKNDKVLQFAIQTGELRQISVYGTNWNTLIQLFGDETDDWKGKTFRLLQMTNASDGKKIKQIGA